MSAIAGKRLPRRILQLLLGLFLYGIGIAFMLSAPRRGMC